MKARFRMMAMAVPSTASITTAKIVKVKVRTTASTKRGSVSTWTKLRNPTKRIGAPDVRFQLVKAITRV